MIRSADTSAVGAGWPPRIVHESRSVIGLLLSASGASAHFVDNPLQRATRDVDVLSRHVIFDYHTSRAPAGALSVGLRMSPVAMV